MKNKIKLKKYLVKTLLISICLFVVFLAINIYEYHVYNKNFNNKLSLIVNALQQKYSNLSEKEIIEILNSENDTDSMIFGKYGIDVKNKSIVIQNDIYYHRFLLLNILFMAISFVVILVIFMMYNRQKEKDIGDITKYIEEINKKNYELNIDSMSEDELSILKNEIYKTTIMLKESAEISNLDKLNLKKSLEDISHQIKTPLTSILVMLDNLIDDSNMDTATRNDFIKDIKREVTNINFLVQAILKLSKFDANTIHFIEEERKIKEIIDESVKNVLALCDLKNIVIKVNGNEKAKIKCDSKWQIEAITNILKNCIEHSKENQKIIVSYEQNSVYSMIEIKDFGKGISKKDLPHIFERFYKGENASPESIGIGLALSKTIIEQDNGSISVDSDETGTKFIIKYYKL